MPRIRRPSSLGRLTTASKSSRSSGHGEQVPVLEPHRVGAADHLDAVFAEQFAEQLAGVGTEYPQRRFLRGDDGQLDVGDAGLGELRPGQQSQLVERQGPALDARHRESEAVHLATVGPVHHLPDVELVGDPPEGDRARNRPEQLRARGDHEVVVGEVLAVMAGEPAGPGIDRGDAVEVEARAGVGGEALEVVAGDPGGSVGLADGIGAVDEVTAGREDLAPRPDRRRGRAGQERPRSRRPRHRRSVLGSSSSSPLPRSRVASPQLGAAGVRCHPLIAPRSGAGYPRWRRRRGANSLLA